MNDSNIHLRKILTIFFTVFILSTVISVICSPFGYLLVNNLDYDYEMRDYFIGISIVSFISTISMWSIWIIFTLVYWVKLKPSNN